jgi:hypothetical protein
MEFGDTEETKTKIAKQIRRADNWAVKGSGVPLFSSPPIYNIDPIIPAPIRAPLSAEDEIRIAEEWATVPASAYL